MSLNDDTNIYTRHSKFTIHEHPGSTCPTKIKLARFKFSTIIEKSVTSIKFYMKSTATGMDSMFIGYTLIANGFLLVTIADFDHLADSDG